MDINMIVRERERKNKMGITQVMIVLQSQFNIIKKTHTQTQLNVSPGYDRLDQSLNDRFSFGTRMLRAT
jgi:hypothetical protein